MDDRQQSPLPVLRQSPPLLAYLPAPQGAKGAAMAIDLYMRAHKRSPWLTGLLTGGLVIAAIRGHRHVEPEA